MTLTLENDDSYILVVFDEPLDFRILHIVFEAFLEQVIWIFLIIFEHTLVFDENFLLC